MAVEAEELVGFSRGTLRTLWYAFGQRRRPLVLAVVARTAASVVMGIPVGVVAWCVDAVRRGALTPQTAATAAAVVVTSVVVQYLLWYVAHHHAWVATYGIMIDKMLSISVAPAATPLRAWW